MLKPCLDCGRLGAANRVRCRACQRRFDHERNRVNPYQSGGWRAVAAATVRRAGRVCEVCGSGRRVSAHHVIPRAEGGPDELWNLVALCLDCHNAYEGDRRAGRTTRLTRIVDRIGQLRRDAR